MPHWSQNSRIQVNNSGFRNQWDFTYLENFWCRKQDGWGYETMIWLQLGSIQELWSPSGAAKIISSTLPICSELKRRMNSVSLKQWARKCPQETDFLKLSAFFSFPPLKPELLQVVTVLASHHRHCPCIVEISLVAVVLAFHWSHGEPSWTDAVTIDQVINSNP